jgi:hypothetical protein
VNAFATIAALTGVLAAGIIYGTDVFCALVQRPALARLDDATMAAAMGPRAPVWRPAAARPRSHRHPPAAAATAAAAVSGSPASATAAGIALIATLIWLGLYLRVAAPINQALTAAAIAHVTPGNARALQSRWDSIITTRALLMAAAVAGLAVSAATH